MRYQKHAAFVLHYRYVATWQFLQCHLQQPVMLTGNTLGTVASEVICWGKVKLTLVTFPPQRTKLPTGKPR